MQALLGLLESPERVQIMVRRPVEGGVWSSLRAAIGVLDGMFSINEGWIGVKTRPRRKACMCRGLLPAFTFTISIHGTLNGDNAC